VGRAMGPVWGNLRRPVVTGLSPFGRYPFGRRPGWGILVGRVHSRRLGSLKRIVRNSRTLPIGLFLCACADSGLGGQELRFEQVPRGVELDLADDFYIVDGVTAAEILEGLRAGRWYTYSWRIEWTHSQQPVRTTSLDTLTVGANERETNLCQTERLDVVLRFIARYPRWEPRAEPAPELREAWAVFQQEVEDHWALHRDVAVRAAREMISRTAVLREPCPLIFREAQSLVDETIRNRREDNVAIDEGYQPVWPPEGFEFAGIEEVSRDDSTEVGSRPEGTRDLPPPPTLANDIEGAVQMDIGFRAVGLAVGLMHDGQVRYLEAFGAPSATSEAPLARGALFPYPALGEILLDWSVGALESQKVLDPEAPISRYLGGLGERLGRVTLDQLLDHRAGLDNSSPPEGTDWVTLAAEIDDGALFTEPGMVTSYSRYSHPLALRVVEAAAERSLEEIVSDALFRPLGMDSTTFHPDRAIELGLPPDRLAHESFDGEAPAGSAVTLDGMPVIFTTLPDLIRLFGSWMQGGVPGQSVLYPGDRRAFDRGLWLDRVGTHPRVTRICVSAGHGVGLIGFPESMSAAVLYGIGGWPENSANFTLAAIDSELGIGDAIYRRGRLQGVASFADEGDARCAPAESPLPRIGEDEPAVEAGDWAGLYRNGDRELQLEAIEGGLHYRNGPDHLPVVLYEGDLHFAMLDGLPGFPLRLVRDEAGRRYAVRGEKAYLQVDDPPGG